MNPSSDTPALGSAFRAHARRAPAAPALRVGAHRLSYGQLDALADRAGAALSVPGAAGEGAFGVFGSRVLGVYAGILGILRAGRTYVPLNPDFPAARTAAMVEAAGLRRVLVAESFREDWDAVAALLAAPVEVVVLPDDPADPRWEVLPDRPSSGGFPASGRHAYLLFTSGSTGRPKGVAISHANVAAYLDALGPAGGYDFGPTDRFSQTFESTFDLSVHDQFVCWGHGAELCVVPRSQLLNPAGFVRKHELTVWFSVPSLAQYLHRFGALKPGAFPTLRWSLFCGEALPAALAEAWRLAAPGSIVENLYGPTEATIALTRYRWVGPEREEDLAGGTVPIGVPLGDQRVRLADPETGADAGDGPGELLLGGSQVADGYWNDPERTAAAFSGPDALGIRWYRTGDLVRRRADGNLLFHGRLDSQVKIGGHRIELGEIEHVLRTAAGRPAVALVRPGPDGSGGWLEAVLEGADESALEAARAAAPARLPAYMVPRRLSSLPRFPLNSNGKIDRRAVASALDTLPSTHG